MEKLYNLSLLREMAGDDEEFITEMVHLFAQNTQKEINRFYEAAENGNWDLMQKTAHSLKPNINTYGIKDMFPLIQEIELLCKTQEAKLQEVLEKFQQFDKISTQAIQQMQDDFR